MLTELHSLPPGVARVLWEDDVALGFESICDAGIQAQRDVIRELTERLNHALAIVDAAEKWRAWRAWRALPLSGAELLLFDALKAHASAARGEAKPEVPSGEKYNIGVDLAEPGGDRSAFVVVPNAVKPTPIGDAIWDAIPHEKCRTPGCERNRMRPNFVGDGWSDFCGVCLNAYFAGMKEQREIDKIGREPGGVFLTPEGPVVKPAVTEAVWRVYEAAKATKAAHPYFSRMYGGACEKLFDAVDAALKAEGGPANAALREAIREVDSEPLSGPVQGVLHPTGTGPCPMGTQGKPGQEGTPPWVCEFCFRTSPSGRLPATWDLVHQCAVCPECQNRVHGDGGYSVVKGGAYAEGRPDPRAKKPDAPACADWVVKPAVTEAVWRVYEAQ